MRLLTLLVVLLSFPAVAQEENPWKNPETQNPWVTEQTPETIPEETDTVVVEADTIQQTELSQETIDLVEAARTEAKAKYNATGDFFFGLTSGLVLNYYGILPDFVYGFPDSKKEKRAVEQTVENPAYETVDPEYLNTKTENAVKSKKFLTSVCGTAVGALIQTAVILGITSL